MNFSCTSNGRSKVIGGGNDDVPQERETGQSDCWFLCSNKQLRGCFHPGPVPSASRAEKISFNSSSFIWCPHKRMPSLVVGEVPSNQKCPKRNKGIVSNRILQLWDANVDKEVTCNIKTSMGDAEKSPQNWHWNQVLSWTISNDGQVSLISDLLKEPWWKHWRVNQPSKKFGAPTYRFVPFFFRQVKHLKPPTCPKHWAQSWGT